MADGAYGLVGALIGGAISLSSAFGLDHIKQRRDAHNLAHAFRGGIGALLSIVSRRRYVPLIAEKLQAVRRGDRSRLLLKAKKDYVEIYSKNVDRIGLLHSDLAEKLPRFYTYVNSLLEDVENIESGMWDEVPQELLIALYEEFHELLVDMLALGKEIIETVEKEYPSPFRTFDFEKVRRWVVPR